MIQTFVIQGRCHTKNSYAGAKGYGRRGGDYKKAKEWEATARDIIAISLLNRGLPQQPFEKRKVHVCIAIYIKGEVRADLTNYFKSICDAMNKLVYYDDKQIVRIEGRIWKAKDKDEEKVVIGIRDDDDIPGIQEYIVDSNLSLTNRKL